MKHNQNKIRKLLLCTCQWQTLKNLIWKYYSSVLSWYLMIIIFMLTSFRESPSTKVIMIWRHRRFLISDPVLSYIYENPKLFAKDLESILNIVKTIRAEKREKIVSIIIYNPTPIFSAVFFLLHNRVEQREQKRFPWNLLNFFLSWVYFNVWS